MIKNKAIFVVVSMFVFFALSGVTFGQGFTGLLDEAPGAVFSATNFYNLVSRLACEFIRFGIIVAGVMFIVYGILFFKGRGSPQGMVSAKKALMWGLVGGLVIFGVFTIILTVSNLVGFRATDYTGYPILDIINCE